MKISHKNSHRLGPASCRMSWSESHQWALSSTCKHVRKDFETMMMMMIMITRSDDSSALKPSSDFNKSSHIVRLHCTVQDGRVVCCYVDVIHVNLVHPVTTCKNCTTIIPVRNKIIAKLFTSFNFFIFLLPPVGYMSLLHYFKRDASTIWYWRCVLFGSCMMNQRLNFLIHS